MTSTKNDLAAEIENRGIRFLCHATHPENLPSIAKHGILSRKQLDDQGIEAKISDAHRMDGFRDSVSCTIEVPNASFMWSVKGRSRDWVVLLLDTEPLLHPSTLFFPTNAARANGSQGGRGLESFRAMYGNTAAKRDSSHVRACPTDIQAEVLVARRIEPTLIRKLVVPDLDRADRFDRWIAPFVERTGVDRLVSVTMFHPKCLVPDVRKGRLPAMDPPPPRGRDLRGR